MNFYDALTKYTRVKRQYKNTPLHIHEQPDEWYKKVIQYGNDGRVEFASVTDRKTNMMLAFRMEQQWHRIGEPYCKVWPHMATMMAEIDIDIPVREVHLPYPAFAILLANDPLNDFREKDGPLLKWIMVSENEIECVDGQTFRVKTGEAASPNAKATARSLYINYEFDDTWRGLPAQFNYTISLLNEGGTVEQFFERSWGFSSAQLQTEPGEYNPSHDMVKDIVRVAIATAFFMIDRHEVVLPDLPRKKIEKGALSKTPRNLGQTRKWTIGREISLPPTEIVIRERAEKEARGGVSRQYIRRGHMRWQPCGKERKDRKLIFIHPHLCRPDLPWAGSRGYRIPDEVLK